MTKPVWRATQAIDYINEYPTGGVSVDTMVITTIMIDMVNKDHPGAAP